MGLQMHHAFFGLVASIWIGAPVLAYFQGSEYKPAQVAEPMITTTVGGISITETQSSFVNAISKATPKPAANNPAPACVQATSNELGEAFASDEKRILGHLTTGTSSKVITASLERIVEIQTGKRICRSFPKVKPYFRDTAPAPAPAKIIDSSDYSSVILNSTPTEQSTCPGYVGADANEIVDSPENPERLTNAELYAERC